MAIFNSYVKLPEGSHPILVSSLPWLGNPGAVTAGLFDGAGQSIKLFMEDFPANHGADSRWVQVYNHGSVVLALSTVWGISKPLKKVGIHISEKWCFWLRVYWSADFMGNHHHMQYLSRSFSLVLDLSILGAHVVFNICSSHGGRIVMN